jgi:hypothetical protein
MVAVHSTSTFSEIPDFQMTPQVAHRREMEMYTKFWLAILKGGDHLEDLSVDGRIILWHICLKQELWSQRNSHC